MIERIKVWLRNLKHWKTARAYRDLQRAMLKDPDYAWSWHCNIAMPIYDATHPACTCKWDQGHAHGDDCAIVKARAAGNRPVTTEQANEIASRLMRHLFKVEVSDPASRAHENGTPSAL